MACCGNVNEVLEPNLFKALGDPKRVLLLAYLCNCQGPCRVSALAEVAEIDISVVSRHLAQLRDAGILKSKKRGKEVYYSVRYTELAQTLRTMANAIEACCPNEETSDVCCG